ncbi:MAG: IPT/TIG domain-containing protein [Bacteroidetes bacterium]|nr:IPT/TIG domain-containing protein [Bacteroidota bacterium]
MPLIIIRSPLLVLSLSLILLAGCAGDAPTSTGPDPSLVVNDTSRGVASQPVPRITDLWPLHGRAGSRLVVRGNGFGTDRASLSVLLNDRLLAVDSLTNSVIVATVPEGASTGPIVIERQGRIGRSPSVFTIVSPDTPDSVTVDARGINVLVRDTTIQESGEITSHIDTVRIAGHYRAWYSRTSVGVAGPDTIVFNGTGQSTARFSEGLTIRAVVDRSALRIAWLEVGYGSYSNSGGLGMKDRVNESWSDEGFTAADLVCIEGPNRSLQCSFGRSEFDTHLVSAWSRGGSYVVTPPVGSTATGRTTLGMQPLAPDAQLQVVVY